MLGIGTSNGEEHDGVFVSGKPAKRLSDTIKDRLMSEKRPDKTLLLLYAAFEQACERRHDINRAESGGLAAKMYVSDQFISGASSGWRVRLMKCRRVYR